jgi:hypothetical protein
MLVNAADGFGVGRIGDGVGAWPAGQGIGDRAAARMIAAGGSVCAEYVSRLSESNVKRCLANSRSEALSSEIRDRFCFAWRFQIEAIWRLT